MIINLGALSPLAGIAACVSLQFGGNEAAKRVILRYNKKKESNSEDKKDNEELTPRQFVICGSAAGILNTNVAAPVEHIRIRMQVSIFSLNVFLN